ncbi:hypothetical protein T265_04695 [Opisthorchis viverrini]|uniref:Uncharacterized protein n=1 Tax=Opisthorchis viverrini TaxID=6198 RepID=A0A074ZRL0_OPIVI|nr:hypothetical protein T265_04695 [Opisthorchis viverrini]KER28467.1 hypothetical protein T265_04695 [Opisthorchis viverrini]
MWTFRKMGEKYYVKATNFPIETSAWDQQFYGEGLPMAVLQRGSDPEVTRIEASLKKDIDCIKYR